MSGMTGCVSNATKRTDSVTIFLIDDDEVDVMGVERAFRGTSLKNRIVVAQDGLAALGMLRDGRSVPRPYLILLDLNMPRMNGIEFLDALRADDLLRDSLVFVLTTSKADEDKHRAYSHNIAGYLVKESRHEGYISAVALLEQYQRCVEFP